MRTLEESLSVAPMMEWTDRHFRYMVRLLTRRTLLYTEMVTAPAIIHGQRDDLLDFNEQEHPVVVQLGGSDPKDLAKCAQICEQKGYDAINLNVGCPSDRVQSGKIGACLMKEPQLVADCMKAMAGACGLPVTVKTRIGVDEEDSYDFLKAFVETVAGAGVRHFVIHARKAWLKGLSPHENRTKPELAYDRVYQLKADFPQMRFVLNGGVRSLEEAKEHLGKVDGVMLGRAAYEMPYVLAEADREIFGEAGELISRRELIEQMRAYVGRHLEKGGRVHHVTRHMLNLFHGEPGARKWRSHLSTEAPKRPQDLAVLDEAAAFVL